MNPAWRPAGTSRLVAPTPIHRSSAHAHGERASIDPKEFT